MDYKKLAKIMKEDKVKEKSGMISASAVWSVPGVSVYARPAVVLASPIGWR